MITVLAFIFMDSVTLQRTNSYYFWYLKRFLFVVSKYNNKKKKLLWGTETNSKQLRKILVFCVSAVLSHRAFRKLFKSPHRTTFLHWLAWSLMNKEVLGIQLYVMCNSTAKITVQQSFLEHIVLISQWKCHCDNMF